jgi:hypothetical protein
MSAPRPLVRRAIAAGMLAAGVAGTGEAQGNKGPGITLIVRDATGLAIVGAELTTSTGSQRSISGADGAFHLVGMIAGPTTLRVRRLGFRPDSVQVDVQPGTPSNLTLTLRSVPQQLAPILVQATARTSGRLSGFYHRREIGNGRFFTREEIEKQNLMHLTDLFRRIPGMAISDRGATSRNSVRIRGGNARCWPLVWLDGNPLAAGEFDLDNIQPNSIDAMEVYSGVATIPAEFMGPRGLGSCGVIVIWSRQGEARPKRRKNAVSAEQLAELVASLKVYTAEQVDIQALPDTSLFTTPHYPDSLFSHAIPGAVVAEFVVDSLGKVENETFGVVLSTHPLFSESVRRAVSDAVFRPAALSGKRVRQLVQLPFKFVPDSTVLRRGGRQ